MCHCSKSMPKPRTGKGGGFRIAPWQHKGAPPANEAQHGHEEPSDQAATPLKLVHSTAPPQVSETHLEQLLNQACKHLGAALPAVQAHTLTGPAEVCRRSDGSLEGAFRVSVCAFEWWRLGQLGTHSCYPHRHSLCLRRALASGGHSAADSA